MCGGGGRRLFVHGISITIVLPQLHSLHASKFQVYRAGALYSQSNTPVIIAIHSAHTPVII